MEISTKKPSFLSYLLSFSIPFFIMFGVLFSKGIYWSSAKTILASDGFHQYAIFAQNLRNILHGSDSIFYTFTSGLGLNFYALTSYYLGSFLSLFIYFFNGSSITDAIYLFTLIKFGLIGLSSFFSFSQLYPKVKPFYILSLSISFSLMSFLTSQVEINNWLDVFILIPLIILGLHRLLEGKVLLYYLSLSLLFIQNYYFGYMFSLFLLLYSLVLIIQKKGWKKQLKLFIKFTSISLCSVLASAFMLIPTYLDLSSHGEELTRFTNLFTSNTWYFDLFSKSLIGVYDTTKFNSIPMLYGGLLPLLLSLLFFTLKSISFKTKISYFLLLLIIIMSYYIEPLSLFWQGMHAPNMFLHRYFWTLPLLSTLLACETLNHKNELTYKSIVFVFILVNLSLALPYLYLERYKFLDISFFLLSFFFLLAYSLILISSQKVTIPLTIFTAFTIIFTSLEMTLNSYYQISGIDKEWDFPSRQAYTHHSNEVTSLLNFQKRQDKPFFRTERVLSQTGNDSMKYNYYGISQFSSIRNRASSNSLDRLGFKSEGTNLNLRYQNNTLLMDSLFAIKYNLSEDELNKYDFFKIAESGKTKLYQNQNASKLAILTVKPYKDITFSLNTLDNQTRLLNQISGQNLIYFKEEEASLQSQASYINNRVASIAKGKSKDTILHYQLLAPANKQIYLSIPKITFSNQQEKKVLININGKTNQYSTDNTFNFFDLGYFKEAKLVDLAVIFPNNTSISFEKPHFYSLDLENYKKVFSKINEGQVQVNSLKNKVDIQFEAKKNSSLFITIPYDKGWTAHLNSKNVPISRAQKGFMKVNVKEGKGRLTLRFVPLGFKEGAIISLVSTTLFLAYCMYLQKRKK